MVLDGFTVESGADLRLLGAGITTGMISRHAGDKINSTAEQ